MPIRPAVSEFVDRMISVMSDVSQVQNDINQLEPTGLREHLTPDHITTVQNKLQEVDEACSEIKNMIELFGQQDYPFYPL